MSETIHSAAAMLHKVGAMDKTTMLEFDSRHFVPNEMAPQKLNRQHC
jgi:putative transcriptional regulator